MTFVLEFFTHVLSTQFDEYGEMGFFNPYGNPTIVDPKVQPTHYTTEGGGTYSARPDLSRAGGPGIYRAAGGVALIGASMAGAGIVTGAYEDVIASESEFEQRSLWQMFSSALTGTFGIGSGLDL